jgi:hypothetical protein
MYTRTIYNFYTILTDPKSYVRKKNKPSYKYYKNQYIVYSFRLEYKNRLLPINVEFKMKNSYIT